MNEERAWRKIKRSLERIEEALVELGLDEEQASSMVDFMESGMEGVVEGQQAADPEAGDNREEE